MTYEIYRYIFIGGAVLAGIMLVVSIMLFFLLKIPTVIGDLTGATARKAIENIRSQNESSGEKTYRTSQVNWERGKLTDKISPSGRLVPKHSSFEHGAMATQKIGTQQLNYQSTAEETTLLSNAAPETAVPDCEHQGFETTVLGGQQFRNGFLIEYEITYIHTNELIV